MSVNVIDLSADMGEETAQDQVLIPWLSSAHIACGMLAVDRATLHRLCLLAARHGVAVGAHLSPADMFADMKEAALARQIEALAGIAAEAGLPLAHVKLHESLQALAERDRGLCQLLVRAVKDFDRRLALFGLAGSRIAAEAEAAGIVFVGIGYPDRRYLADGMPMSRDCENATLPDPATVAEQALRMVEAGEVLAENGRALTCRIGTLCLLGCAPGAVAAAAAVSEALTDAGIAIAAPVLHTGTP